METGSNIRYFIRKVDDLFNNWIYSKNDIAYIFKKKKKKKRRLQKFNAIQNERIQMLRGK